MADKITRIHVINYICIFLAYRIHMSNFTYDELDKLGGFDYELRGVIPIKVV